MTHVISLWRTDRIGQMTGGRGKRLDHFDGDFNEGGYSNE